MQQYQSPMLGGKWLVFCLEQDLEQIYSCQFEGPAAVQPFNGDLPGSNACVLPFIYFFNTIFYFDSSLLRQLPGSHDRCIQEFYCRRHVYGAGGHEFDWYSGVFERVHVSLCVRKWLSALSRTAGVDKL